KEENLDGSPLDEKVPKIAPSRWETVDESELEAQAMTTSKWDMLEHKKEEDEIEQEEEKQESEHEENACEEEEAEAEPDSPDRENSSSSLKMTEMSEGRRAKLREIEVSFILSQLDLSCLLSC
ncbi:U2 snRNP-associated SURP motif-containing protein-like, partial [Saccoglossus kowalevskii]